jgi:LysR family transcriptional regulator, hydrogen peroxide-inducible genes activator
MQMQQVRYFLAVCKELNFTRAAERCDVAQPSLSRAIRQLEIELGGDLFVRAPRGVHLTKLGRAVKPFLERISANAERASRAAKAGTRRGNGMLRSRTRPSLRWHPRAGSLGLPR